VNWYYYSNISNWIEMNYGNVSVRQEEWNKMLDHLFIVSRRAHVIWLHHTTHIWPNRDIIAFTIIFLLSACCGRPELISILSFPDFQFCWSLILQRVRALVTLSSTLTGNRSCAVIQKVSSSTSWELRDKDVIMRPTMSIPLRSLIAVNVSKIKAQSSFVN
jgi:hypothetical protein